VVVALCLDALGAAALQPRERWRRHSFAALCRLQDAGIAATVDEQAGAEVYEALRSRWDALIAALGRAMAYLMPTPGKPVCMP
jgi:hypothetical protein